MNRNLLGICMLTLFASIWRCDAGSTPPCVEHGPYTNVSASCGYTLTSGQLSQNSFCVNLLTAVPIPTLSAAPTFANGTVTTTISHDCSPSTVSTSTVTYTASALLFNPNPPADNVPGSYSSDCYVNVTSSDTNDCSSFVIDYGTVTWNITDVATTLKLGFDPSDFEEFMAAVGSAVDSLGACVASPPTVKYEFEQTFTPMCCADGTIGEKKEIKGSASAETSAECDFPFAGIPYVASVNVTINASASAALSIGGEVGPCEPDTDICGTATITGTVGGGLSGIIGSRKIIYVTGTIQGSISGQGKYCYNTGTGWDPVVGQGCIGPFTVVGAIQLFSGISHSYSATIAPQQCMNL